MAADKGSKATKKADKKAANKKIDKKVVKEVPSKAEPKKNGVPISSKDILEKVKKEKEAKDKVRPVQIP